MTQPMPHRSQSHELTQTLLDRPGAVEEKIDEVTENIEALVRGTDFLKQASSSLRRSRDADFSKIKRQVTQEEHRAKEMVKDTSTAIRQLQGVGDASVRRRVDKLGSQFRTVMKTYEGAMKDVLTLLREEGERRLSSTRSSQGRKDPDFAPSRTGDYYSKLDDDETSHQQSRTAGGVSESAVVSVDLGIQQEKLEDLQELEKDLRDLGTLFEDVAVLVHAQGEELDLIETHVEQTSQRVSTGVDELVKAKYAKHS